MTLADLLAFLLSFVLLCFYIHQLSRCSIKVRLHLLQITTFFKQVFTDCTALVLKDLLAFKVSTLSALHELVTVILVPILQV